MEADEDLCAELRNSMSLQMRPGQHSSLGSVSGQSGGSHERGSSASSGGSPLPSPSSNQQAARRFDHKVEMHLQQMQTVWRQVNEDLRELKGSMRRMELAFKSGGKGSEGVFGCFDARTLPEASDRPSAPNSDNRQATPRGLGRQDKDRRYETGSLVKAPSEAVPSRNVSRQGMVEGLQPGPSSFSAQQGESSSGGQNQTQAVVSADPRVGELLFKVSEGFGRLGVQLSEVDRSQQRRFEDWSNREGKSTSRELKAPYGDRSQGGLDPRKPSPATRPSPRTNVPGISAKTERSNPAMPAMYSASDVPAIPATNPEAPIADNGMVDGPHAGKRASSQDSYAPATSPSAGENGSTPAPSDQVVSTGGHTQKPARNYADMANGRGSKCFLTCPVSNMQLELAAQRANFSAQLHMHDDDGEDEKPAALRSMKRTYAPRYAQFIEFVNQKQPESMSLPSRVIKSNLFDSLCTLVIVANSFFIGYSSEFAISNPANPISTTISRGNWFFVIFYFVELSLRLMVFKLYFFINAEWKWNIFDMLLVCSSIYSTVSALVSGGAAGGGSNVLRLLRLMKMMKMLRLIRVMKFFRELRLMLMPIITSLRSLFWTLCMLAIIMYIFGIIFLQATAGALVDAAADPLNTEIDDRVHEELHKHWGSVATSMITLYFAVTGGNDWAALAEPLKSCGLTYYAIFLFYIAFLTFAVLNILTGIFVETAMSFSQSDNESVTLLERENNSYLDMVAAALPLLDVDRSGALSYEEFAQSIETPEVQLFLEKHDMTEHDARILFWRISSDGLQDVAIPDLVHVFARMKGGAKDNTMDLQAIQFDLKRFASAFSEFSVFCLDRLDALEDVVQKGPASSMGNLSSRHGHI